MISFIKIPHWISLRFTNYRDKDKHKKMIIVVVVVGGARTRGNLGLIVAAASE